jgi:DNA-directed RNA polymerase specialized sigma24 family protein
MTEEVDLHELDRKINALLRLFAYSVCAEMTVTEAAPLLDRLGLSAGEIADVMDSTPNTVRVRISEAKKAT